MTSFFPLLITFSLPIGAVFHPIYGVKIQRLIKIFIGTVTDIAGEVVELGSDVKKFKTGAKDVAKLQDTVCFNNVLFVASLHIVE